MNFCSTPNSFLFVLTECSIITFLLLLYRMNGNDLSSLLESKLCISTSEWEEFIVLFRKLSLSMWDAQAYKDALENNARYLQCIYFDINNTLESQIKSNLENSIKPGTSPIVSVQYSLKAYEMLFQVLHDHNDVELMDEESGEEDDMYVSSPA